MAKKTVDVAAQLKAAVSRNGEHYRVDVPAAKKITSIALTEDELRLLAKAEAFLGEQGFYTSVNKTQVIRTLIRTMTLDEKFVKVFQETVKK